ncbi:hypothetical protein [Paraburkholderia sp.]|uniref:hypothetical protein n=1 Tax=Paraburkholderia sp. TaxID=1926495 RepID=UPI0034217AB9
MNVLHAGARQCAAFLIGSENGIQNALTASFMMKAIDAQRRVNLMPAYILCIQISVFFCLLSAGMIGTAHLSIALLTAGIATVIVGASGFGLERQQSTTHRYKRNLTMEGIGRLLRRRGGFGYTMRHTVTHSNSAGYLCY